jgi:hypothetical protein
MSHAYLEDDDLFVAVFDGDMAVDDFAASAREAVGNDDWWRGCRRLVDVTTLDVSTFPMTAFAAIAQAHVPAGANTGEVSIAIVATGVAEASEKAESEATRFVVNMSVFDNVRSASIWLGVDAHAALRMINELRRGAAD